MLNTGEKRSWTMYSRALNQKAKIVEVIKNTWFKVECEDGTVYSQDELNILARAQRLSDISKRPIGLEDVHAVKKVFSGTIIYGAGIYG